MELSLLTSAATSCLMNAPRFVVDFPRWLFLGTLVFAPWAYGCTREWAIDFLDVLMAVILLLWLAGCVLRKLRPAVSPALVLCAAILLLQGWWMAANPHFQHDADLRSF